MFKSLSHFEFVYGEKMCSNFTELYAALQLSQHYLLKRLSYSHCISSLPLSKIVTGGVWVYFWALCSVPLIHMAVSVPVPHCLQLLKLCSNQKSGRIMPSALFFFFRIVLAIVDLYTF